MDHAAFRAFHAKIQDPEVFNEVARTQDYLDYVQHMSECDSCSDLYMADAVKRRGARVEDYPCVHIAYRETFALGSPDPDNDPDVIIRRFSDGGFGIPVRDGGPSMVVINYCPWCGVKLPVAGQVEA